MSSLCVVPKVWPAILMTSDGCLSTGVGLSDSTVPLVGERYGDRLEIHRKSIGKWRFNGIEWCSTLW